MFKARSKSGFDQAGKLDRNLAYLEADIERKEIRNKIRVKRKFHSKRFCSMFEFEFQLYLGDKPFPRKKMMTVAQANIENRKLRDSFAKKLDKDIETTARMSSYKHVDFKQFAEARKGFISRSIERSITDEWIDRAGLIYSQSWKDRGVYTQTGSWGHNLDAEIKSDIKQGG